MYAGGGEPTVSIRNVVASVDFCDAWLVESDSAPVRIQGVRMEGCGGLYRNHGVAGNSAEGEMQSPRRFSDILIDVSAHSNGGGLDDAVIDFANVGPLYIVGGSFGGSIKLAPRSQVFSIGTYFESDHSNAVMRGMADNDTIAAMSNGSKPSSFCKPLNMTKVWPYRGHVDARRVSLIECGPRADTGMAEDSLYTRTFHRQPGATIHELHADWTKSVRFGAGTPPLGGRCCEHVDFGTRGGDGAAPYTVLATAGWNAGAVYTENRSSSGFEVCVEHRPNSAAKVGFVDVLVRWETFRGWRLPGENSSIAARKSDDEVPPSSAAATRAEDVAINSDPSGAAAAPKPEIFNASASKLLFFDDQRLQSSRNLSFTLHRPTRAVGAKPLVADLPWESRLGLFHTVVDNGTNVLMYPLRQTFLLILSAFRP